MSKMVVDNPKCGLQVSTCFYNASVKSRYEIGHFFASVRMAKGNSSLDNYDIAIDLAKNKK